MEGVATPIAGHSTPAHPGAWRSRLGLRVIRVKPFVRRQWPKPEHQIHATLEREVTADRWTSLVMGIKSLADEVGLLDLRPEHPGPEDPFIRRQMIRQLQDLEAMGLAATDGGGAMGAGY